jgi:serine/threonine protein phosphatase PrpC
LRIVGKTDPGLVRKTNQDDFACGIYPDGNAWAVVCDGMGGVNGGSIASSTAVRVVSAQLTGGYEGITETAAVKKLLFSALSEGNKEVYNTALKEPSLIGMGTTVIACIATNQNVFIAHAGDSRAYIVGKKNAVLLTRDHSIVQEMLESGKLKPEEALNHPQRNIITRALGVDSTLNIDFCETTFTGDAVLLICTDGLTNLVDNDTIVSIVHAGNDDAQTALIAEANARGGSDNITVVLINK